MKIQVKWNKNEHVADTEITNLIVVSIVQLELELLTQLSEFLTNIFLSFLVAFDLVSCILKNHYKTIVVHIHSIHLR